MVGHVRLERNFELAAQKRKTEDGKKGNLWKLLLRFLTIFRISVTMARILNFLIARMMLEMTTIVQMKFVHITSVMSSKLDVLKYMVA